MLFYTVMKNFWKPLGLTKGDAVIFAVILLAALLMLGGQMARLRATDALVAEITGPLGGPAIFRIDRLPSGKESYWDVDGAAGGLRLLYCPGKGFCVSETACPDRACARTGFISKAGQSIVCVPNKITLRLSGGGKEGADTPDAVTR